MIPTYADLLRPASRRAGLLYDLSMMVVGSWLIALSAQITIPLPFSPVPITGQTFAVLFLAMMLGSRRGAGTILLYLGQGLMGWPVFAGGGAGPAVLMGPTAGYLLGFVPAAFLAGWLAEKGWDRHPFLTILAMIAGNSVIYLLGVGWLSHFLGLQQAIMVGLFPFLLGDLFKIILAAWLLPLGWKWVQR